jgi:polyhydroxyalkanoate synthesis regulator phasin
MENKEIVKQMMDLHKKSFENYFSMMVMLQDQTEKILKPFVDQAPSMSDEGKKVLDKWTSEYKKSREDFKKAVDNGYAKVEAFFDYNSILNFQEQNEKMFNEFLDQASWMPDDFKKAVKDLTDTYKNSRENFKKYIDKNVNHVDDFFSDAKKTKTKLKKPK